MSLDHVKVFCVVDGVEVPDDRKKRRSITCSDACAARRNSYLREKKELKKCKYCGTPSSPEERDEFRQWRAERRAKAKAAKKLAVAE